MLADSLRPMPSARARVTILGLGSLLSERSSRVTFPNLSNFRVVRVLGWRRVFAHSPSVFVRRGIGDIDSLQLSSLSAEPCEGGAFYCTAFDVDDEGMPAFREREEEYELEWVPFIEAAALDACRTRSELRTAAAATGLLCCRSSDEAYIARWGRERWDRDYASVGLSTIWGWQPDSGIRPCSTYLRHCVLAAQKLGKACYDSFLDETFLVDRKTTVRAYLAAHPEVMATEPPPELRERYGG